MIFKRNNTYWYKFCWTTRDADGVSVSYVVRRSAKTSNKRQAQEMQEEHRRALRLGQVHPRDAWPKPAPPEAPTFADFTKRFVEHEKLRIKASSVRFYEIGIGKLVAYSELGSALISNINGELIAKYIRRRLAANASATTLNCELRTLRRILHIAYDWEIIDRIPAVHELPSKAGRERVISFEEESKYLAFASPTLRRAAIMAVDTGVRPNSELFPLEWSAVDLDASTGLPYGAIRVKAGKTSNAVRVIPLTPRAREAMLQQRESAPHHRWVFPGCGNSGHLETLQNSHRKAIKKAKLEPFVFYSWRHTFGTRAAESGMDRFTLAKLMGHSSPRVTERYYVHITESHVSLGFEKFLLYQAKGLNAATLESS